MAINTLKSNRTNYKQLYFSSNNLLVSCNHVTSCFTLFSGQGRSVLTVTETCLLDLVTRPLPSCITSTLGGCWYAVT